MESVRTLAGKQATLTFWAKADAARSVSVTYGQNFGTGGSPSSTVSTSAGTVNLTTSWQKFTVTVAIPSISGKTIGTNGDDFLQLQLGLPLNTTMTIDLAQAMINEGSVAAPWVFASGGSHLNYQAEYIMCLRYCWGVSPSNTAWITYGVMHTTTQFAAAIRFPIPMRAAPTVTTSAGSTWVTTRAGSNNAALNVMTLGQACKETVKFLDTNDTGSPSSIATAGTASAGVMMGPGATGWFIADADL
jgi:hypothetical protein